MCNTSPWADTCPCVETRLGKHNVIARVYVDLLDKVEYICVYIYICVCYLIISEKSYLNLDMRLALVLSNNSGI